TRRNRERIQTVEIAFRPAPASTCQPIALSWSSTHAGDGIRRIPDEAVMITGDGNLVELQATLRYVIDKPRVYLFEVGQPSEVLRAAAEAVLREAVAAQPFLALLTTNRERFQQEALTRIQRRCQDYG